MSIRGLRLFVAVAFLCAVVAGAMAPTPAAAQGTPVTIEMGERGSQWYFDPKELTVPAGHTWIELVPAANGDVTFAK